MSKNFRRNCYELKATVLKQLLFVDFPLIRVRRKMYKPTTTAGKGIKWEWLSLTTSEWNLYNMDVQNIIEDAWAKVIFLWSFSQIF